MILYEYEGLKLIAKAGLEVPTYQLLDSVTQVIGLNYPIVLKAQVLSGKRADDGGILFADDEKTAYLQLKKLLESTVNKEKVEKVLLEERIEFSEQYYLSFSYDTDFRSPIMTFSISGGTGIEERGAQHFAINPLNPTQDLPEIIDPILLENLLNLFFEQDLLLLEINPLVKLKNGNFMALDAKIKLDDNAAVKHKDWSYPPRSVPGYTPTKHEFEAKKIDEGDYRGTAGSTYFDFEGDIAVLASGGGASITALDALKKLGGKPANYTEYSGNPPREKVEKLAKIVLNKPNIHGLWVVGALANFTDIYETLSGIVDALEKMEPKPDYPVVIRRAGPRDTEAFEMLKQIKDLDLHVFGEETSIPESAKVIVELAEKFAQKK